MQVQNLTGCLALTLAVAGAGLGQETLKGSIRVDGSSTVYLITEAMATNFKKLHPGVDITVGIAGTGGGFKKFYQGETDISDASRKIKPIEIEECKKKGISYLELQVGWDGLAIIINKDNDWARKMTVEQLKKIWHPSSAAKTWKDVEPSWPDEKIALFGPGADSGTFDYFTEVVNGKEKVSRTDYRSSEDDNNIINGVVNSKYALGYLGVAYYEAHKDKLAAVAVFNEKKKEYTLPTPENVLKKRYAPLARPLFIYVKTTSLQQPHVREFVRYYLLRPEVVAQVKYVPMNASQQYDEKIKLEDAIKASK